jgi:ABC transport system ATP-binding/permease protein
MSKIYCVLKNLSLSFGPKNIFQNAQLSINQGERIGIIGRNGEGKSSLLKIICGELSPDSTTPTFSFDKAKGTNSVEDEFSVILIPQELILEESQDFDLDDIFYRFYPEIKDLKKRIEAINKKIETNPSSEEAISKLGLLMEEVENLKVHELEQKFYSYMKYFGFIDSKRKWKSLSGGEQRKILLSVGLSTNRNIVLWDEPTNHLDIETIEYFEEDLLATNKTYIFISHDRYFLGRITNRILYIEHSQINRFNKGFEFYLEEKTKRDELHLRSLDKMKNKLRREEEWMRQGIKARGTRAKSRVDDFLQIKSQVSKMKAMAQKKMEIGINEGGKKSKIYVSSKDLSFEYPGKKIIENFSFSIYRNDRIGILGENGQGKSTIAKIIARLIDTSADQNVKYADDLVIKYFSQNKLEVDGEMTPFELIGEGLDHIILPDGQKKHVISYFEKFSFSREEVHRPLRTFSGGEKSRLQLAVNLKHAADLWIFDEPTNDLDLESINILEETLASFKGTVLIISHDRAFLTNVTNKIWYLKNGKVDVFNCGLDEFAPYQKALQIEEEMLLTMKENESVESTHVKRNTKTKLTNKEKMRLKALPQEIEKLEKSLEVMENKLEDFDFQSMNEESRKEFEILSSTKIEQEDQLLSFYEELENIEK